MATAISKPPPISLIHQIHRVAPLAMAQTQSSRSGGPWRTLMEAHVANISSHKALLETLAQGMQDQKNLDPALVESMEAMYSRTTEIMAQAESVRTYFDGLAASQSHVQPTTARVTSNMRSKSLKPQDRSRPVQGSAPPAISTGRRRRSIACDGTVEDDSYTKRRRVATPSSSTDQPTQEPAQEPDVEYVDVSKEVLRRLAATRERRMAKKVAAFKEADDAKRKRHRQSSGSERSLVQVEDASAAATRPKKRIKSRATSQEAEGSVKEAEEGFASAEGEGGQGVPGAFSHDIVRTKEKIKRTKSIV